MSGDNTEDKKPNEGTAIPGESYVPQNKWEEKAITRGWRPKDEWQGDPDEWVDARTFSEKGELMDTISGLKRKVKDMEVAVESTKAMKRGIEKAAYEKAKRELILEKAEKLRDGDYVGAAEVDEKIKEKDREIEDSEPVSKDPKGFKAYFENTFLPNNSWYNQNKVMKVFADSEGAEIYRSNPGIDPEELYAELDRVMRKQFPEEFGNKNRHRAPEVGHGGTGERGNASKSDGLWSKLPAEAKKVGMSNIKQGIFESKAEFAKSYFELTQSEE